MSVVSEIFIVMVVVVVVIPWLMAQEANNTAKNQLDAEPMDISILFLNITITICRHNGRQEYSMFYASRVSTESHLYAMRH